jgi:hypothetical protein
MSEVAAVPPAAPAEDGGFFGRLFGLYFSPGDSFRAIAARPMVGAALLAFFVLNAAFIAIWVPRVDPREYAQREAEKTTRFNQASPEQQAQMLSINAKVTRVILWVFPAFALLGAVIIAAALLLVFKLFYSSPLTFKQSLAIVLWTGLATGLVTVPLTLLVMALKGDWNVNPTEAVMANAAALLDRNEAPKVLYALAGSIDLFSFWTIFLYSTGYAAAARRSVGSAAAAVVGAWALAVLLKAAVAAIS